MVKERGGNVLMNEEFAEKKEEFFEELMNVENERGRRTDGGQLVNREVQMISKEEVGAHVKRVMSGKVPHDIQKVIRSFTVMTGCQQSNCGTA